MAIICTKYIDNDELKIILSKKIGKFIQDYSFATGILNNKLETLNKETYHFLNEYLRIHDNEIERVFCNSLLGSIYKAETLSHGSGIVSFIFGSFFADYVLKNPQLIDKNEQILLEEFLEEAKIIQQAIEQNIEATTQEKLLSSLQEICYKDNVLSQVVYESLMLAGLEGKIFVENGKQFNYVIEHKEGYNFFLKPYKFMLDMEKSWERNNVKVLLVDGFVENVSEIDMLLQKSYEFKQPMVIFAHGFSEEVVATLKTNQERRNFDINPIRIPTGLESINTIVDLSVVCGMEPVSSLKGDMLVFVKYENLPEIRKVTCGLKETVLESENTKLAVNQHIRHLLSKRNESSTIDDVQQLIDKRLRSLVSNAVIFHLPEMSLVSSDATRVDIDNALRAAKTLLNYGTVNIGKIAATNNNDMSKAIHYGLSKLKEHYGNREVSALSLLLAIKLVGKDLLQMICARGIVIKEL